jgi:hypothetical protein
MAELHKSERHVYRRNAHRITWSVIERFDWGTWSGFPIGGVYLHDGHFVRAFALNPPFDVKQGADKTIRRALAGLNEELERALAASSRAQEDLATVAAYHRILQAGMSASV